MGWALTRRCHNFLRRENGPMAVEYAVMLALVIMVCLVVIKALGTKTNQTSGIASGSVRVTGSVGATGS